MKIKKDIIMQKVGNIYVAASVGARAKNAPCMIKLNESGAFLWNEAKKGDVDVKALADALVKEYEIHPDTALTDAEKFVESLVKNGLVE